MKTYLYIILTMIFFALVGIGFLIYKSYEVNKEALGKSLSKMLDETSDKVFVTNTHDTVMVENNNHSEPEGSLAGKLCYPSQGIPPLNIYIENVETGDVTKQESDLNQDSYKADLAPGTYIAYAYVKGMEDSFGGYTEAVPCGLSVDCEDHKLIEFKIVDQGLTSDIDICDWYGAEVPEEPSL